MSSFTKRIKDRLTARSAPDPYTLAAAGTGLAFAGVALAVWHRRRTGRETDECIATERHRLRDRERAGLGSGSKPEISATTIPPR